MLTTTTTTTVTPLNNSQNETMPENLTWIGDKLSAFDSIYQPYHGYICLCVCCFGFVSNLCNIIVLTRKNMISPFNQILTALALADLATIISYIPYATYFYCVKRISETHNYWWVLYLLFNTNFIITTHTIAMWLTVFLAVFRYLVVCHPTIGSIHCNQRSSLLTIILVYLITPIMCIPIYIQCYIVEDDHGQYWYKFKGFANEVYKRVTYFIYAGFFKLAPCILLTVLSFLLIVTIKLAEKKRQRLLASRHHVLSKSYSDRSSKNKMFCNNKASKKSKKIEEEKNDVVNSHIIVELKKKNSIEENNETQIIDPLNIPLSQNNIKKASDELAMETLATISSSNNNCVNNHDTTNPTLLSTETTTATTVATTTTISTIVATTTTHPSTTTAESNTIFQLNSTKSAYNNLPVSSDYKSFVANNSTTPLNKKTKSRNERTQESVRTTVMLVAVVLSFVFVELPQGVLVALSGINYSFFFMEIYKPLGDIFDLLGLLNSTVNFVLYCTMSRQFRETFVNIFFHCCIKGKQKCNTKSSKETNNRKNDCENCLGGCCGYKKFCLTTSTAAGDRMLMTRLNHTKQR